MSTSPAPSSSAALGDGARLQLRNQALLEGDRLMGELKQATDPAVRQQLAEKITFQQMLANAMDDEAYISGGAIRGFALGQKLINPAEQYQALLDQVGMIAHAVKEAGGVLEAARRYELFKYVNRICALFEQAGVQDERLAFFKHWSELVYKVDRDATGALDRPGGVELTDAAKKGEAKVTTDAGAPHVAPSDQFLLDNYGRFGEMVEHHGLDLGKKVQGDGGGPTGSPQLLRLPRPTVADGAGGGTASPALPKPVAGDGAALMQRLTQSRRTLEEEIAATEGAPAQRAAAERALADIRSKPFRQLTPADLMVSSAIQQTLFDAAGGAVERMKAFAGDMLKGADAEIISIRKREDLAGFVKGILEKCERKDYPILGQMDDIIRGRLNITDGPEVAKVAQAMREQSGFPVKQVVDPRVAGGVVRYPRYHIIVEDPLTGLTHEWQIGTKATSTLYETQGIELPPELEASASKLGKHFRTDIHDIEYDIFQAFNKREPGVAAELGIPHFIAQVAGASERSAAGAAHTQPRARTSRPCTRTPNGCCRCSRTKRAASSWRGSCIESPGPARRAPAPGLGALPGRRPRARPDRRRVLQRRVRPVLVDRVPLPGAPRGAAADLAAGAAAADRRGPRGRRRRRRCRWWTARASVARLKSVHA